MIPKEKRRITQIKDRSVWILNQLIRLNKQDVVLPITVLFLTNVLFHLALKYFILNYIFCYILPFLLLKFEIKSYCVKYFKNSYSNFHLIFGFFVRKIKIKFIKIFFEVFELKFIIIIHCKKMDLETKTFDNTFFS